MDAGSTVQIKSEAPLIVDSTTAPLELNDVPQGQKHIVLWRKKYYCPSCPTSYYEKYYLRQHINAKHKKDVRFNCNLCSFTTHWPSSLKKHTKAKHLQLRPYKCQEKGCNYECGDRPRLVTHVRTKHRGEYVICPYCGIKSITQFNMNKHINRVHLGVKDKEFRCSQCDETLTSKKKLDEHLLMVHELDPQYLRFVGEYVGGEKASYTCDLCKGKFFHRRGLISHFKNGSCKPTVKKPEKSHKSKKRSRCDEPVIRSKAEDTIIENVFIKEEREEKSETTENVSTTKKNEGNMKEEEEEMNETFKKVCPICKAKFNSSVILNFHLKLHSNNEKAWEDMQALMVSLIRIARNS